MKFHLIYESTDLILYTVPGVARRGYVDLNWDGKVADGRLAADGMYTWQMVATTQRGFTFAAAGPLTVIGGRPTDRDHVGGGGRVGDSKDDLLALTAGGSFDFWHGTGTGPGFGQDRGAGLGYVGECRSAVRRRERGQRQGRPRPHVDG